MLPSPRHIALALVLTGSAGVAAASCGARTGLDVPDAGGGSTTTFGAGTFSLSRPAGSTATIPFTRSGRACAGITSRATSRRRRRTRLRSTALQTLRLTVKPTRMAGRPRSAGAGAAWSTKPGMAQRFPA